MLFIFKIHVLYSLPLDYFLIMWQHYSENKADHDRENQNRRSESFNFCPTYYLIVAGLKRHLMGLSLVLVQISSKCDYVRASEHV